MTIRVYQAFLCLLFIGVVFGAEYSCRSGEVIPFIDGQKLFIGGEIIAYGGSSANVYSPIIDSTTKEKFLIGQLSQMTGNDSLLALEVSTLSSTISYGQ